MEGSGVEYSVITNRFDHVNLDIQKIKKIVKNNHK